MAEIGSAFLCVKAGVRAEPREDHAHYLKSWIGVMKADNRAIFTAASAGVLGASGRQDGREAQLVDQIQQEIQLVVRQQ